MELKSEVFKNQWWIYNHNILLVNSVMDYVYQIINNIGKCQNGN